jgi:uncharacterized protein YbaA (DUF1428 family)
LTPLQRLGQGAGTACSDPAAGQAMKGHPMNYVDGFVIPVPSGSKEAYRAMSEKMTSTFKRLGALRVVECWGDDVPDGKVTDFKRAVAAQAGETVVFGWVEWPSKEVRDKGNKAMMEDPAMKDMDMPFDGKRMIYGGFQAIHDSKG